MKRKVFFWIDKLQIKRSERISVSILMAVFLTLSTIWIFNDPASSSNNYNYEEIEQMFRERSKEKAKEKEAIMVRYTPYKETKKLVDKTSDISEPIAEKSDELKISMQEMADTIRININKANAEELQKLPGIGPAYSERIVDWRTKNGEFKEIGQLLEIRGIGPVRLEKIRPMIILKDDQ